MNKKFQSSPVRCLCVIIAKGLGESVIKSLMNQGVSNCYITLGIGTAQSDTLDYFGLDGPEKEIILCAAATDNVGNIFRALSEESKLKKAGYGIAFSIPVSAISVKAVQQIKKPMTEVKKERNRMDYELIAALTDKNTEDEIMKAARSAGASGGTIIRGRKAADGNEERFLNISIHPEKEIILIVAKASDKKNIMKAIDDEAKNSNIEVTQLSFPVDDVFGIN